MPTVAESGPGECAGDPTPRRPPRLRPRAETSRPLPPWTPAELSAARLRALLEVGGGGGGSAGSAGLPVCELMLGYRVMAVAGDGFASLVTLTNNREIDASHWQV